MMMPRLAGGGSGGSGDTHNGICQSSHRSGVHLVRRGFRVPLAAWTSCRRQAVGAPKGDVVLAATGTCSHRHEVLPLVSTRLVRAGARGDSTRDRRGKVHPVELHDWRGDRRGSSWSSAYASEACKPHAVLLALAAAGSAVLTVSALLAVGWLSVAAIVIPIVGLVSGVGWFTRSGLRRFGRSA